jgi:2,4-dienoyl-CoA reductase (NADPH2)
MARPFLADPHLVSKSRDGREDEINTCIGCNQACLDHVFVGKVSSCLVNPRACHETDLAAPSPVPESERLSLGVVGAGPAGCAFAITAAQQGHTVTLYDQGSEVGGQFNMAKRIPGKEEFHETLRYFRTMLKKHGVQVQLETRVSSQDMENSEHSKWIVAAGVNPRDPKIPGQDHPSVLSYIDVLKHRKPVGKRVAVIGAGGIGFDVGEYLLHYTGVDHTAQEVSPDDFWKYWGIDPALQERGGLAPPQRPDKDDDDDRQIFLLQRKKGKLGKGLGKTTGWIHRATLGHGPVEMLDGVVYEKIDENGNLHILQGEKRRVLEVDNIVFCAGQVEANQLVSESSSTETPVFCIGGAYEAGELDAKRAIDMGTRLAMRIHQEDLVPGEHVEKTEEGLEERLFNVLKRFR